MDYPITPQEQGNQVFITNYDLWYEQTGVRNDGSTGTWFANFPYYTPIRVPRPMTVKQLYARNGGTVSGNCDIALYANAYGTYRGVRTRGLASGSPIVSAGSTAQAGASLWQAFNVTDKFIAAGLYWLAYVLNNSTGTTAKITTSPTVAFGDAYSWQMLGNIFGGNSMFPLAAANPSDFNVPNPSAPPLLALGGIA